MHLLQEPVRLWERALAQLREQEKAATVITATNPTRAGTPLPITRDSNPDPAVQAVPARTDPAALAAQVYTEAKHHLRERNGDRDGVRPLPSR